MDTFEIDTTCPWCGQVNEAASGSPTNGNDELGPEAGSVYVCFTCGKVAIFDWTGDAAHRRLGGRKATPAEILEITENPSMMEVIQAIQDFIAREKGETS